MCTCTGNYYGTQCQLDGEVMLAIFFVMFVVVLFACTFFCHVFVVLFFGGDASMFFSLCSIMTHWPYPSIIYSLTGPFFVHSSLSSVVNVLLFYGSCYHILKLGCSNF